MHYLFIGISSSKLFRKIGDKFKRKKRWSEFIVPLHLLLPVYYQIFNRHPKEIKSNFFHSVRNFATKEIARVFYFFLSLSSRAFCVGTELAAAAEIYIIWIFSFIFCGRNFLHGNKREMKFLFLNFSNFFHAIIFWTFLSFFFVNFIFA